MLAKIMGMPMSTIGTVVEGDHSDDVMRDAVADLDIQVADLQRLGRAIVRLSFG